MQLLLIPLLLACRHGAHGELETDVDVDIEEAECCMGPKRWEASDQGWQSWRVDSFKLEPAAHERVSVSLTKGLTYRFEACGASDVSDLDLILYDNAGNILVRDSTTDREPVITFTETESTNRHLVVYLRGTHSGEPGAIAYGWASLTGEP